MHGSKAVPPDSTAHHRSHNLTDADLQKLERESWIDPPTADAWGLYRVTRDEGADLVGRQDRGDYAGLAIPVWWPGELTFRENYLRRDHPDLEATNGVLKPKQRYLAPPERGNILIFGPNERTEVLVDASVPIVLVEGLKKTVAAWRLARWGECDRPRFLACGVMGCWGWRGTTAKTGDEKGQRVPVKGPISDLDKLAWIDRPVMVLFDSDTDTNSRVRDARAGLMRNLRKRGACVTLLDLPPLDGLDKTGFDDLLASWGPMRVLEWLKTAECQEETPLDLSRAVITYTDLLSIRLPERSCHLPWLGEGSNSMVFGPRGIGKTFFQLGLAAALTTGQSLLTWPVAAPVGVLYVDGEMQLDDLRDRTTALMDSPPKAPLEFLTSQWVYQRCGGTDVVLTSGAMQQQIIQILNARPEIRVLILDNIACLFSGINEDKKEDWEPVNRWLIHLRHRGIATLLSHHAGKGGQQRGTSGREDLLGHATIELTVSTYGGGLKSRLPAR